MPVVPTESDVKLSLVDLDIAAESTDIACIDSLIDITPNFSYLSNQLSEVFDSKNGGGQINRRHYINLLSTRKKPRKGID